MAITGSQDGVEMTYVCLYAPHQPGPRESFYRHLEEIEMPSGTSLVVGGDFNCTIDPRLDLSHFRRHSSHESAGFEALQTSWRLCDALEKPTERDEQSLQNFYKRHHTYRYTLPSGEPASARLDRWYTTPDISEWIKAVEVCNAGAKADHQAVRLHLVNPQDPIRVRRPARVYPPPNIATVQGKAALEDQLESFHAKLQESTMDAQELAGAWVAAKTDIRRAALRIIKQRRKTARASYKQRCRRLLRQEARILDAQAGVQPTVETITDLMDALTLKDGRGGNPLQHVRSAITDCIRGRLALRQRRLYQRSGYRKGATTKQFYRRVSTKSGDTKIHRLDAADGHDER